ncbi:MAG: hypothetical protein HGA87_01040 [Desulfobulbaceae bacterium]|nr:hypothetical protein [Desulfobulbaceae bacterium]
MKLTRLKKYVGRGLLSPEALASRCNGDFSNMTVRRALAGDNIDRLKARAIAKWLQIPIEDLM